MVFSSQKGESEVARPPPAVGGPRRSRSLLPRREEGCHGHLPPFLPLDVRGSDRGDAPPLFQKRHPFSEKGRVKPMFCTPCFPWK